MSSSGYFGDMANERGGSSRKGKKSNSDKPKQPQRGLGVAQLEKIRLHGQFADPHQYPYLSNFNQEDMGVQAAYNYNIPSSNSYSYSTSSSSSPSFGGYYPNVMMGTGDYERSNNNIYGADCQFDPASWNPTNNVLDSHYFAQPASAMRSDFNQKVDQEMRQKKNKKYGGDSMALSCQSSDSNDTREELDLELRLSI